MPLDGPEFVVDTETPGSAVYLLSGTQYWLVAAAGAPDTTLNWRATTSSTGLIAFNTGSGFFTQTTNQAAFDVLGGPVPEPATAFLTAGGLALILFGFRRRRRSVRF